MDATFSFCLERSAGAAVFWTETCKSTNFSRRASKSAPSSAMRAARVLPGTYSVARAQEPSATWETSSTWGCLMGVSAMRATLRASLKTSPAGLVPLNTLTTRLPSW